jgi:glycosyltransferase involved in cell wall biosynthesis
MAATRPERSRVIAPPPIASVKDGPRPLLSVVIPTYEPDRFLVDTLRSVLAQDLGPAQMQIAIVDDSSTRVHVPTLVAEIAPVQRIELHEHDERLGLAGNWNRAIDYARGEFVHILHQDDTISPGFYRALLTGLRSSERVGMAFCRHAFINERNELERVSHRERWRAGVLPRWLDRISERQHVQCPAAIVRRDVYQTLGGFRNDLPYTLDWEMWARIASAYRVWYEPRVLASYRRHGGAETARLEAAGQTISDMMTAIATISTHLPPTRRRTLEHRAYRRLAHVHARRAAKLIAKGSPDLAAPQLEGVRDALARLPDDLRTRWSRWKLERLGLRADRARQGQHEHGPSS